MLYGQVRPTLVKLLKMRRGYAKYGLKIGASIRVIAFDENWVLGNPVNNSWVVKISWKDVMLIEMNKINPVPIVNVYNDNKINSRQGDKKSIFNAKGDNF